MFGGKGQRVQGCQEGSTEGFPEKLEECVPILQPFHKNRLNLSIVKEGDSEIVFNYDSESRLRLLIPKPLRNRVKQMLHADHRQDLTRVKLRAQEHVYWPNTKSD